MILTEQNYHSPEANLMYMGASQFKSFQKCPSMALSEIREDFQREETKDLLIGSYIDAHFSRTLDIFIAQHPQLFYKNGSGKLLSDYVNAEGIIQRIQQDEKMMYYLTGDHQVIMTGYIGGVQFKIKIDCLGSEFITDQKIMKDFGKVWSDSEGCYLSWVEAWGYDIQGAIYQEIVRQNTGTRLPFILAAATKEKTPDIGLFNISQARLDYCLDLVEHMAPEYEKIKTGDVEPDQCGHCDWCKQTKVLTGPVDYTEVCA